MADVLLLGEDRDRAGGLGALLRQDGHRVVAVRDTAVWRERERESAPDLVIAAVESPDAVLGAPGRPARGFPAALLFVHHDVDPWREIQLDDRLVDRLQSPFMAEEFLGRVDALVRVRRVVLREAPDGNDAPAHGWKAAVHRFTSALGTRVPRFEKPPAPYLEVAARVADFADRRDGFEPGHAERVTSFSAMIADELGLPDSAATPLLRAAMLHDIGKVALPVEMLRQTGPLEERQIRLLRTHADRGAKILRALDDDESVAEAILYHHERVDGKGYHGRSGDDIPLAARILAVAESYDAMTTSRVRAKLSGERAQGLLREHRGGQFDGECVDALCKALKPSRTSIALSR